MTYFQQDENTNTQGYSLTNKNVYFCNIVYIENILQNTNITVQYYL